MTAQPHNIEAEQALLGALLSENRAYDRVSGFLEGWHFFEPVHGRIYELIGEMLAKGASVSPVTLKIHMEGDLALKEVGGANAYLARLVTAATAPGNTADYGSTVFQLSEARVLHQTFLELTEEIASRPIWDLQELIGKADAVLRDIRGNLSALEDTAGLAGLAEGVMRALNDALMGKQAPGQVTTGLNALDALMGPMMPGGLVIIGARPSMGKTTLGWKFARTVAETHGHGVHIASLEMTADQIIQRALSDKCHGVQGGPVHYQDMVMGKVTDNQVALLDAARHWLVDLPINIDDRGGQSTQHIRAAALKYKARLAKDGKRLGLVLVDYLGHIRYAGTAIGRTQQVGEITKDLKNLAKELGCPVVVPTQLNRAVEARENKRPLMSDLRESGDIEQDADIVMMLYRDEYYVQRQPSPKTDEEWAERKAALETCKGQAEIIVTKTRMGAIGNVAVYADMASNAFRDLGQHGEGLF